MNQSVSKQMRRSAEFQVPMYGSSPAHVKQVFAERKRLARLFRKQWLALPWNLRRREKVGAL